MKLSPRLLMAHAGMRRLLMCDPACYDVTYKINPWMAENVRVDKKLAREQWTNLKTTFEKLGVQVDVMTGDPATPDIIYTANAALVRGNKAFIATFKCSQRQAETAQNESYLKSKGYQTHYFPDWIFEGQGDARFAGQSNLLFVGYGQRSTPTGLHLLEKFFGCEVVGVELVDPRFYHLDTCFSPLSDSLALIYKPAFTPEAFAKIEKHMELILLSESEATKFAANSVSVSPTTVVFPAGCDMTAERLSKRGINSHLVDVSEFLKGGGAVRCLTLDIDQ